MYKQKLCIGVSPQFGANPEERLTKIKEAKFDGFFVCWDNEIYEYKKSADKLGLIFQSLHAPFMSSAEMWTFGKAALSAVDEQLKCLDDCAKCGIPIMVMHTYKGFDPINEPNAFGIENYRKIVEQAAKKDVKVAFENTEGEEYLDALMNAFKDYPNVGFCWDTGHELCYNKSKDMTSLYGDRLICTHLNDNLGISDFDGNITFLDDLHLLPFDGISDWQSIADRLNKHNYNGLLTFELNISGKYGRHDNDKYGKLTIEEYLAEAYARACRVSAMKLNSSVNTNK